MDEPISEATSFAGARVLALVLGIGLVGTGGYAAYEHRSAAKAAEQTTQMQQSLASTQDSLTATNAQVAALTAKLNDLTAPPPSQVMSHSASRRRPARRASDERFKKMQAQLDSQGKTLDEQGKAIESTRQDLAGTRTELQGSIAHTHDELVVLQKKGERNYYEFDVDREKGFRTTGPVGIRLRKANVKHQYADLELEVNDASLTKKHVNLLEPAVFYAADSDMPVELVINRISKNHIHGYVSTPKYRRSELSASSQAPDNDTTNSSNSPNPSLKSRQPSSATPH